MTDLAKTYPEEQATPAILSRKISSLTNIGPERSIKLTALFGGNTLLNALLHLPVDLLVRKRVSYITNATSGDIVSLIATVDHHTPPKRAGQPYKVTCYDGKVFFELVFFKAKQPYIEKILPLEATVAISGKAEHFLGKWQIVHPDFVGTPDAIAQHEGVEAIYPLCAGITNKLLTQVITSAFEQLPPQFPEWLSSEILQENSWPSFADALKQSHTPKTQDDLSPESPGRRRLAFDELLAHQLSLHLTRRNDSQTSGKRQVGSGTLCAKVLTHLPYCLTGDQEKALAEIYADMNSTKQMLRLVQGDVGCGKTLVAFLAMLRAIESHHQAALLAPTDILARQHYETLQPLAQVAGIEIDVLTGRDKGKSREKILDYLKQGRINLLIGTHALIQEPVVFQNLGLAVIDEQHRFGVEQRLALSNKGNNPDILAMSATPIPRTLTMALYGDLDTSIIKEKPAGRQPIETRVLSLGRLDEVVSALSRALKAGRKVYWVCPLVEESEKVDLAATEERYNHLKQIFPDQVGLVHGKMKPAEKDSVMQSFLEDRLNILIATTVIEVGVNVPKASIMVIEHSERFGLTQLHQLRGRIGRGDIASTCLLLYAQNLGETARRRLLTMRETQDGFKLAEEDLKIRGGGDVLGTRQSGLPKYRLVDWEAHSDLLPLARSCARQICESDPALTSKVGEAARLLLRLFCFESAAKYTRS